jgi:hypothetical protein
MNVAIVYSLGVSRVGPTGYTARRRGVRTNGTRKKNGAPPAGKRAGGSGGTAPPCCLAPSGKSEVDQKWYSAFTIGVLADAPGTCLLSLPNLLCQYW